MAKGKLNLTRWRMRHRYNCRTGKGKGKGKKGKIEAPRAVRTAAEPGGIAKMSKDDAVKARQDNRMALRSLKHLTEGHSAG